MTNQNESWPAGQTATMNVTYTQANGAGGAVVCEISPGAGNEFILLSIRAKNSGTNGPAATIETATGGTDVVVLGLVGSAAGTILNVSVGSVVTSSATTSAIPSGIGYPVLVSGSQALKVYQTGAGAQNDTFQVLVNIRVKNASQMPTVTHANSTNAANVSATAGSEGFTVV